MEQEYNDKVNGTVYFNLGDVYNIIDASGNPTQITVVANEQGLIDNGDGTVNVTSDGVNVVAMEKDIIQDMVSAAIIGRIARNEAERTERLAEQTTAEAQMPTTYERGDKVDVVDDAGNVVTAEITYANDDGYNLQLPKGHKLNGENLAVVEYEKMQDVVYRSEQQPTEGSDVINQPVGNSDNFVASKGVTVHTLTADEAQNLIADMEIIADVAPEIELTIENWDALFGESGIVNTPIGEVKMGENQFAKLMRQGREGKLGMIKPTLENPHVIIEEASEAKEGDRTERASSYIFVRSFKKADGSRFYYFTSITVSKDGKEVVVSNQEKSRNKILRLLQEGNVIWHTPKDVTTSSAERQGLDYEQPNKAETATKGSEITPQSTPSLSKDSNFSEENKGESEKVSTTTSESLPIDYEDRAVSDVWNELLVANEGDAAEAIDTAEQMYEVYKTEYDKVDKRKAKGRTPQEIQRAKSEKKSKLADLQRRMEFWQQVSESGKDLLSEQKRIEDNSRYLEAVRSSFPDGKFKEIVIGKHRFTTIDAMEDFFKEHNKSLLAEMKQMKDGEIAGEQKRQLTIQIGDFSFVVTTKLTRQTVRDGATLFNDVERKMTYSCAELGIEDIPVRQNLLRNAIEDITHNVITGRDFSERLEVAERSKKHNEAELEQLLSREGKPFEYEAELEQAKAQYKEYTELMKKELAEKEAKYAEMDATVEVADDLSNTDEDDDTLYRSDDKEVEYAIEDFILNKDNATDFEYALMESIAGQSYSARSDYKVLNGVEIRVKDHTPDWDNFVDWETGEVKSEKILNVTVGDYENTDYRRHKEDYESFVSEHPETTAVDVYIEDGTSLADALSQIHKALKDKGIDFEFAPDYSWAKWYSGEENTLMYRDNKALLNPNDAIKNRIEALFNQAISGEFKGKPISIGRLTDAGKAYLKQISGVSFKERVDFVLNPSDLVHIYKGHFGNNEKDKGQNIPLDIEDVRSLADVISSPDKIVFFKEGEGSNRNMFYFFKEAEDGTYNLMEIYSDRKGNLTSKTFYKTRKDATQRVMDIEKSLLPTSETYSGAILSAAKIPQMFESTSIEEDFSVREGYGSYSDEELSMANDDPVARMYGESSRSKKQQRQFAERMRRYMRQRVQELSARLNVDIEIVEDASTLEGRRATSKGFYNKRTGKITVVLPNNRNIADVEQTVFHEAVGHYGLRRLLGEQFDRFLDNVYEYAEPDIRERIARMALRNGFDIRKATEEYLAMLAEDTELFRNTPAQMRWFAKIKRWFAEVLHTIGFKYLGSRLSDNELRYYLWLSYENLQGRLLPIFQEASEMNKRQELGLNNYGESLSKTSEVAEAEQAELEAANEKFNEGLLQWDLGELATNEYISVGLPQGILKAYIPNIPIILRQKVLTKSVKRHTLSIEEMMDLPIAISNPIFIFKSNSESVSILTELADSSGKNLFVAIGLETTKQMGHQFLEVNDILTIHGREVENIILPIINNDSLVWVDKNKGLNWLSSAKTNSQAITNQDLYTATKIIENFENPTISDKKSSEEEGIMYRNEEASPLKRYERKTRRPTTQNKVGILENFGNRFIEAYQDNMHSFKVLQESISQSSGKAVKPHEDAYTAENRMSSENKAQAEIYHLFWHENCTKSNEILKL